MTNQNDSFIDEVTEELRRDRLFKALRRYGWIALLLVLAVVAGTAWHEYRLHRDRLGAEGFGDAILAAQASADPAAAMAAIEGGETRAQQLVQAMLAAALTAEAGKPGDSAQMLRDAAAAAEGAKGPGGAALLHDLALLKAVMEDPAMDLAARDEVLMRLSVPGAPFRLLALEQKAIALIGAGRDADAADLIRKIQEEDGLSEQMSRRLAATLITLGETAPPSPLPEATAPAAPAAAPAAAAPAAVAPVAPADTPADTPAADTPNETPAPAG